MLSRMLSAALFGIEAILVRVEAHGSSGLPAVSTVGLPDNAVRESRERVRSAILNSGLPWPQQRLTINLAPADIRKNGSSLDLPVAVAIVALNEGAVSAPVQEDSLLVGELALDGTVRPVHGVLSVALEARARGLRRLLVPAANAREAAVVEGIEVVPLGSLSDAVGVLNGTLPAPPLPEATVVRFPGGRAAGCSGQLAAPDMADVKGQLAARRALEVAAAGGHNILMIGPPGAGKTMLARRLAGILPDMTLAEAIAVTQIHSAAGRPALDGVLAQRPFRSPHHTASDVALVGGGGAASGPRPGEVSLAHHGVLFLDELPEFHRHVLEVLRQPLEEGAVTIARAARTARFPAAFTLVATMNPCPCGYLGDPRRRCTCTPPMVARYRSKLSGPLLDRIDLHIEVPAVPYRQISRREPAEASLHIRRRVTTARALQQARYSTHAGLSCNARLPGALLPQVCALDAEGSRLLHTAMEKLGLSARAHDRVLRLARTIADLAGEESIRSAHVAEAIQYRMLDRAGQSL